MRSPKFRAESSPTKPLVEGGGSRQSQHQDGRGTRHAREVSVDTELVSSRLTRKLCQMATKAQHSRRYRPLPSLLRSIREEAGMTQRQLGAAVKKPQSWVYNCEVGNRRVDVAEFCDWCDACRVDPASAIRRFTKSA